VYLATDRSYPTEQQGPIRFKNSVAAIEDQLRRSYPGREVNALLDKFRAWMDDQFFWTHRFDGLAMFGSPNRFEVFDLQRQPPEAAVVADRFHLKPLVRYTQSADRFQVLCLQREKCWLLEGNRYALDRLDPKGVPTTIAEAMGDEIVLGREAVARHGKGTGGTHPAPDKPTVPQGQAAEGSDADRDTRRFFQAVDKAVWERHSRPSGLPLVLAALSEHQALFRAHSKNPQLVRAGVEKNPAPLDRDAMTAAAWTAMEPLYQARLAKFTDDFEVARSRGMASDDLSDVAAKACAGRVGVLLIDADRRVHGRLDRGTGRWQPADAGRAGADDVLDDLGAVVMDMKGTVVAVPSDRMPTATGAAAVYRF
jgi:hypothetical protein